MKISQITTVKDRSKDLLENLPKWTRTDIDELIIVDYSCPDSAAKKVIKSKSFSNKKVKVLCVPEKITGPFYNHGHARNIGAKAAQGDLFLFVNVDTFYSNELIENIREIEDNDVHPSVYLREEAKPYTSHSELKNKVPEERYLDDNFVIRNAVFYDVNGYSEDNPGWGAVSYDLIIRAMNVSPKVKFIDFSLRHKEHSDEIRDKYLPFSLSVNGLSLKDNIYDSSYRMMQIHRQKSSRAQPGRAFAKLVEDESLLLVNSPTDYNYIQY